MGLTTYPPSGGAAVWGDITGSVSAQTDLTTAFGTQGIKRYCALLTQTGTDAPVATVLENSLGGTVVWARALAGSYTATLASAFTVNKTGLLHPGTWISSGSGEVKWVSGIRTSANVITVTCGTDYTDGATLSDIETTNPLLFIILVYP